MTETIATVTSTFQLINEFSKSFLTRAEDKDKRKNQDNALLHSYYLELTENDNILKAINFTSGIDKNSLYAAKTIAPLLQNEFGKILCIGFSKYQKSIENIANQAEPSSKAFPKQLEKYSLKESIFFSVNRIDFIKSLISLNKENQKFLKELHLVNRLKNIKSATSHILTKFDSSFEDVMNDFLV